MHFLVNVCVGVQLRSAKQSLIFLSFLYPTLRPPSCIFGTRSAAEVLFLNYASLLCVHYYYLFV